MFDRVTTGFKHATVCTDRFFWVHLANYGVDVQYRSDVEDFVYGLNVPALQPLFRQLGLFRLYHGMFCDTVSPDTNAWGPAYV